MEGGLTVHIVDRSEIIVGIVELSIVSFVIVVSLVGGGGEVVLRKKKKGRGGRERSARDFWTSSLDELVGGEKG